MKRELYRGEAQVGQWWNKAEAGAEVERRAYCSSCRGIHRSQVVLCWVAQRNRSTIAGARRAALEGKRHLSLGGLGDAGARHAWELGPTRCGCGTDTSCTIAWWSRSSSGQQGICISVPYTTAAAYRLLYLSEIGSLRRLAGQPTLVTETVRKIVIMCESFLTVRDEQVYLVH